MSSSEAISTCDVEPLNCLENLTEHEEALKRLISDLESREKNFTESLKKINDTLENLVNAESPEIPEFLLTDPSKLISVKKKKKKCSRLKTQSIDESAIEIGHVDAIENPEIPQALSLKDLAKKFDKVMKIAKEQGVSTLVKPLKEAAMRLRELSQAGCTCEIEATLDDDEQDRQIDRWSDAAKIYGSGANTEVAKQESGTGAPRGCSEWGGDRLSEERHWTCDKCQEMCDFPESNSRRVPDARKTRKHRHKSKHRKKGKTYVECRIGKESNDKDRKIQDLDVCGCSDDLAIDKLHFVKNATQEHATTAESWSGNAEDEEKFSRFCEDLQDRSIDRCENDPGSSRRVPDDRNTRKHRHESKHRKKGKTYVECRIGKGRIDEDRKIQDPDDCGCFDDLAIDKLQLVKNATQEHATTAESWSGNAEGEENFSRTCEDLEDRSIDRCENDPESLKIDLCILRSLIKNVTDIDKSVVEKYEDKKDPDVRGSMRDKSMIQSQMVEEKGALKDPRGERSGKEAVLKDLETSGSLILDPSMIHGSLIDKNLDGEILREFCPFDDGANVKDEACQCVDEAEETGRSDRPKKRLKDHAVKDEEQACQEFNVKRYKTPIGEHRETSRTDRIARSSPTKEIIIFKGTYHEDNGFHSSDESDHEDYGFQKIDLEDPQRIVDVKTICPCGCDVVEEPLDPFCPCNCAEEVDLDVNDRCKDEENATMFWEPLQNGTRRKKRVFERLRGDVQSIMARNDQLKKCPCGCAEMQKKEDNERRQAEVNNDVLFLNERAQNRTKKNNEDIEQVEKKLEDIIYSVESKNEELKKLIKSCYCDEDVDEILDLQWSQPPPIRATYSGLTAAIKVLQSKCHTKDRMITVLANELRGSKDVDQIAKNLTAPCLQFTYWDFDQCGLYSYLQRRKLPKNAAKFRKTNKKLVAEKPKEEISRHEICQTPKPTNFRVVREICSCLLVSWNHPGNIQRLRGYEIVINGNVVAARVKNPTRTEAVLGPFDLSGSKKNPGSIILTIYAIDSHGQYSEPSSIKY